jgi:hypothetical protein
MSMMNSKVQRISEALLATVEAEQASMRQLTTWELTELEHEMEHLRNHQAFSIRTAAEMVRVAAKQEREARIQE